MAALLKLLVTNGIITEAEFFQYLAAETAARGAKASRIPQDQASDDDTHEFAGLTQATEHLERQMITNALTKAEGVQTRAAELLRISERALRYKLRKYGLQGEGSTLRHEEKESQSTALFEITGEKGSQDQRGEVSWVLSKEPHEWSSFNGWAERLGHFKHAERVIIERIARAVTFNRPISPADAKTVKKLYERAREHLGFRTPGIDRSHDDWKQRS